MKIDFNNKLIGVLNDKNLKHYKFNMNIKGTKERGFLVPLEYDNNLPIQVNRIFFIYNVPKSIKRGAHAYKKTKQVLICVSGSIKISCFDGKNKVEYELNNPEEALYVSPNIWRETYDHSSDAVILVLSSLEYNEQDYIRDYDKYMEVISCT